MCLTEKQRAMKLRLTYLILLLVGLVTGVDEVWGQPPCHTTAPSSVWEIDTTVSGTGPYCAGSVLELISTTCSWDSIYVQLSSQGTFSGIPGCFTSNNICGDFSFTIPGSTPSGNDTIIIVYSPLPAYGARYDTIPIVIQAGGTASFMYPFSSVCKGSGVLVPQITGASGGTFESSYNGGQQNPPFPELSIDPVSGIVDLSSSDPGSYEVEYALCGNKDTKPLQIVASPDASFSINAPSPPTPGPSTYCGDAQFTVDIVGVQNQGTFVVFDSTGSQIGNLVQSVVGGTTTLSLIIGYSGPLTIVHNVNGSTCPSSYQLGINVIQPPNVTIDFPQATYCLKDEFAMPSLSIGPAGGTYSFETVSNSTMTIDANTGQVSFNGVSGTFSVRYTTNGASCQGVGVSSLITVNPSPKVDFEYGPNLPYQYCPGDQESAPSLSSPLLNKNFTSSSDAIEIINVGLGTFEVKDTAAGFYTITMEPVGCEIGDTVTIEVVPLADATIAYPGIICVDGSSIAPTYIATPQGTFAGTINTLNTTTGVFNSSQLQPNSGTDTVFYTVQNVLGCSSVDTVQINGSAVKPATFTLVSDSICTGVDTVKLDINDGGSALVIGEVFIPALSISDTVSFSAGSKIKEIPLQNAGVGVYPIFLLRESLPCRDTAFAAFSVYAPPQFEVGIQKTEYCSSDSFAVPQLNVLPPGLGHFELVNPSDTFLIDSANGVVSFNGRSGTFQIAYFTDNPDCNSSDTTGIITVHPSPVNEISDSGVPFCSGSSYPIIQSNNLLGGIFSSSDTSLVQVVNSTVFLDSSAFGNYEIFYSYTDTLGCGVRDTLDIYVKQQADAAFSYGQTEFCLSTQPVLPDELFFAGGNYTASAATPCLDCVNGNGALRLDSIFLGGFDTTDFMIIREIEDDMLRCGDMDSVAVSVIQTPNADFLYGQLGENEFCMTGDSLRISQKENQGEFTFTTSSGGNLTVNLLTGTIDYAASDPGTYLVTHTVDLGSGCIDVANQSVTLEEEFPLSISLSPDTFCANDGDPYLPTLTGSNPNYNNIFQGDSTLTGLIKVTDGEFQPVVIEPGTHFITVESTSPCGERDSVNFEVVPLPDAQFDLDTTLCANEGTFQIEKPVGAVGYFSSPTAVIADSVLGLVDINNSAAITHQITFTEFNGECSNSTSENLRINPIPEVGLRFEPDTVICIDEEVTIRSAVQQGNLFYGDTVATITELNALILDTLSQDLDVLLVRTIGICSDSARGRITVIDTPYVLVENPDTTLTLDEPLQLDVIGIANFDNSFLAWTLYPVSNTAQIDTTSGIEGPFSGNAFLEIDSLEARSVLDPGIHRIEIHPFNYVRPGYQCRGDTLSFAIDLLAIEGVFFIPEVFTPNGDGVNDVWNILAKEQRYLEEHSAEVYNRAGGKVWEVEKLSDGKWDGGNNPDGVYWWLIKDKDGVVQYTGGLTLLTKRVEQ